MPLTEECRRAANDEWIARTGPAAADRLRLFRDRTPELIFRGDPMIHFLIVPPAIGYWLEHYWRAPSLGTWASIGVFAGGWLVWTLVEYLMHRFLFHALARISRPLAFVLHGHHHVSPLEQSRLAATPVMIVSMAALFGGLWELALPSPLWMLAMSGSMCGYLAYEAVHHLVHHDRPKNWVLRAIAKHHLAHHYETSDRRWGISSPLWDWIFRSS
jgi:hypothetical protein